MLFDNPYRIENISYDWDTKVRGALAYAEGKGQPLPSPRLLFWRFPNGLVTSALTSRDMLLAGIEAYDVQTCDEEGTVLDETELKKRKFPLEIEPQRVLNKEEVEEYLLTVEKIKRNIKPL